MDTELLIASLRKRNLENITPAILEIKEYEEKVDRAERESAQLKGILEHLKQKHLSNIVISWRDEIKDSLYDEKRNFRLLTFNQIIGCIEKLYYIEADRRIKNMIVTTLSKMWNEEKKKVGKVEHNGENYYGHIAMFSSDGSLKQEYISLLK
jgi:predicted RNase H-like nuclease (RuvC/YqgF family)